MEISSKIIDIYTVKRKELITPQYLRITFSIPKKLTEQLSMVIEGSNNKLFIPPKGINVIYFPDKQNKYLTEELMTLVRTYTNRKIDLNNRDLAIDFVMHKNYGPGSNWAFHSNIEDAIGIRLKLGIKSIIPKSDNYFLIGDHRVVPLFSAILEQLPSTIKVDVLIEVHSLDDELYLKTAAKAQIIWLHNQNPENGSLHAEKAKSILNDKNKSDTYVYIAAEDYTVNNLKKYLKSELLWDNNSYSAVSYWTADDSKK